MGTRPIGECQVQPEWRKKILLSLPSNGDWKDWKPSMLIGDYIEEIDEDEDGILPDYEDWRDDQLDWLRMALKELEFLGQVEVRRGARPEIRLTEAGAAAVLELNKPKSVAA